MAGEGERENHRPLLEKSKCEKGFGAKICKRFPIHTFIPDTFGIFPFATGRKSWLEESREKKSSPEMKLTTPALLGAVWWEFFLALLFWSGFLSCAVIFFLFAELFRFFGTWRLFFCNSALNNLGDDFC